MNIKIICKSIMSLDLFSHDTILDWGFDIFAVEKMQNPLTTLVINIFKRYNLYSLLNIDVTVCTNYFLKIEAKYSRYPNISYHTNLHACDVVQSVCTLLETKPVKDITPLHLFSTITAAAVHDVAHFGVTNKYLCEINDPLAILYNYDSILERYHATTAFLVAKEPNCNIFESLNITDQQNSQELIIKIILNTDMTKHNTLIERFTVLTALTDPFTSSVEDYLSIIVHMADLGNSSKPWVTCHEWAVRIMNEFYALTDKQRERNITVEYDITKLSFPATQIQFIEAVIKPMWLKWDQYIGYNSVQTINVNENLKMWHKLLT